MNSERKADVCACLVAQDDVELPNWAAARGETLN